MWPFVIKRLDIHGLEIRLGCIECLSFSAPDGRTIIVKERRIVAEYSAYVLKSNLLHVLYFGV